MDLNRAARYSQDAAPTVVRNLVHDPKTELVGVELLREADVVSRQDGYRSLHRLPLPRSVAIAA
jgi:hypothetical protein